ncbi:MAG: type IV pilus secretin PilQ family protein [Gammaproteobacteria bacterium]|nr:type IV pilus secretin PilQ family protein [Gammaproteobacteria bacterium]
MRVVNLPGEVTQVRLMLTEPLVSEPTSFSINNPAKVILDLKNIGVKLRNRKQNVGSGELISIEALEAGKRSRVILNMTRMVNYEVIRAQNEIHINLGRKLAISRLEPSELRASQVSNAIAEVEHIDFRRGENGEGRIIVNFSNENITVDMHEEGGKLIAELLNSQMPDELEQRLDVIDFATPVRMVDSYTENGVVRLLISMAGEVKHLAYQRGRRFIIEVSEVTEEDRQQEEEQSQYKGEKLTLNFQDIEVRAVLQIIADFTGLNIVASDSVSGNVTLRLQDVPWDEAMDIILKSKGLAMRQTGTILMVAPSDEIAERDKRELESQKQRAQLSPLQNMIVQINYAKATDIASLLKSEKSSMLSARGNVTIDERTNKLLIKDTQENLNHIRKLVRELDIPVRQVLIESRIVIANDDFSRDIGSRFGITSRNTSDGEAVVSGSIDAASDVIDSGGLSPGSLPNTGDRLNVNLPVTSPAGALGISVLRGDLLLDLELTALQTEGRGEVISNPRVITSNQKEAEIEQGVEIPYLQATSSGATSVAFKKAVLSLRVTPQITPDDNIIMDLRVSKDSVGEVFNGVPSVNTREVNTQVLVRDGDTVVLGGIYEQTVSSEADKVPLLGDIPVLGALFRSSRKVDDKAELLIFVTPKVLRDGVIGE